MALTYASDVSAILLVLSMLGVGATTNNLSLMKEAAMLIDEAGGFTAFVQNYGIGGVTMVFFMQVMDSIQDLGTLTLGPIRALGHGLIMLIDFTFVNMLRVFDAGTATTVKSFVDGTASLLGPLAQPTSVGIMMLSLGVFMYAINKLQFSPLSFIRSLRR